MAQLRFATQKTVELIIREYERKAGKILLVVNSYAQAQEVQQTLEAALRKANCSIHVCRMISDAISTQNDRGIIRRGEVGRFTKMSEEILIAPAMAIERGHNIVDEIWSLRTLRCVFLWCGPWPFPMISNSKAANSMALLNPIVSELHMNQYSHIIHASVNLLLSSGQK